MRSWLKTMVVGAVMVMVALLANPTWAKEPIQVTRGQFAPYADALEKDYSIAGMATMVRSAEGYTSVTVRVYGLAPDTSYEVHVHNQACRIEAGGGHYQHEIGGTADASNEMWPAITTNSGGNGYSKIVNDFVARTEARSVVIHDADSTRLACADLRNIAVTPYTFGTKKIEEMSRSAASAANPELMAARFQSASTKITPADPTFLAGDPELLGDEVAVEVIADNSSANYAANPELLVVQRYEFVAEEADALGSTHYADNPELMVAERFEAEIIRNLVIVDTIEGLSQ